MSSPIKSYKDGIFIRELRMFLLTGIFICAATVYFLLQKQYFDYYEIKLQRIFDQHDMRLKLLNSEGLNLVASNPVCQFYHHKNLDDAAVQCLVDRVSGDSIESLYTRLSFKGYKVSSAWWLGQRYLNLHLIDRMSQCISDLSVQGEMAKNCRIEWMAYQFYREDFKFKSGEWVSMALVVWVILAFPVRWGWYFWHSKKKPLAFVKDCFVQLMSS